MVVIEGHRAAGKYESRDSLYVLTIMSWYFINDNIFFQKDWPQDSIFTGKLRIVSRGKLAIISLIDADNKIFASCPVTDESSIERTLDSGRYFVLKIQNQQGKHGVHILIYNRTKKLCYNFLFVWCQYSIHRYCI